MIDKLERLLRKYFNATPKDTYLKLLEQFDQPSCTIATLPGMLVEFWKRIDIEHFRNGPTFRDMMYSNMSVRHKNISELQNILMLATGAIAQEDEEAIHEISVNQFATFTEMTVDDYFAGLNGGSVPYLTGVVALKEAMTKLGQVLEHETSSYHCRMLNRLYNDILSVTTTIIHQMKDA